ncbi:hypothetical protein OXYTRIMIC_101 [Oxytricha trifallax]|uniref:Uncharacterized protein n=1 Tax=Oxytricha trifallax TaxID=1172189 RepID=A0A073HZ92_9SPIT|nr:hypothetical protein OXYTRIMIC_101 [Oxytricha trifallax]
MLQKKKYNKTALVDHIPDCDLESQDFFRDLAIMEVEAEFKDLDANYTKLFNQFRTKYKDQELSVSNTKEGELDFEDEREQQMSYYHKQNKKSKKFRLMLKALTVEKLDKDCPDIFDMDLFKEATFEKQLEMFRFMGIQCNKVTEDAHLFQHDMKPVLKDFKDTIDLVQFQSKNLVKNIENTLKQIDPEVKELDPQIMEFVFKTYSKIRFLQKPMPMFKDLFLNINKAKQNIKSTCGELIISISSMQDLKLRDRDFTQHYEEIGEGYIILNDRTKNTFLNKIDSSKNEYKELLAFEREIKMVFIHDNKLITNAGIFSLDSLQPIQILQEQELLSACIRVNKKQVIGFQMYHATLVLLEWQQNHYEIMFKQQMFKERYSQLSQIKQNPFINNDCEFYALLNSQTIIHFKIDLSQENNQVSIIERNDCIYSKGSVEIVDFIFLDKYNILVLHRDQSVIYSLNKKLDRKFMKFKFDQKFLRLIPDFGIREMIGLISLKNNHTLQVADICKIGVRGQLELPEEYMIMGPINENQGSYSKSENIKMLIADRKRRHLLIAHVNIL